MMVDDPPERLYFSLILPKQGWQCHHFLPSESTQAAGLHFPYSIRQYCQIGDDFWREMLVVEEEEGVDEEVVTLRLESSSWLAPKRQEQ